MADRDSILPPHIEGVVRLIQELHDRHDHQTSRIQRAINRSTALVGRPVFVGALTAFVAMWVVGNVGMVFMGAHAWDPPPFGWLSCTVSVAALYTTVLILTTQRHDDQLAYHREKLALELAILGEQKSAKIIRLLEEMRRDSPDLVDRFDPEAHAMSIPTGPASVLSAHHEPLTVDQS